jgi:hypothetical protein
MSTKVPCDPSRRYFLRKIGYATPIIASFVLSYDVQAKYRPLASPPPPPSSPPMASRIDREGNIVKKNTDLWRCSGVFQ